MKYCFILNSRAGNGKLAGEISAKIDERCSAACADHDIFFSDDPRDTDDYAARIAEALGDDEKVTFIACGGDGTLCQTVGAVMKLPEEQREKVAVGVIPMGTGNDFVSNFNNKDLFFDIDAQLEATPIEIDLLKCNDVYSINMINIGFDCQVVCKKEQIGKRKWLPRKLAYIFSLVITLIKKPGVTMDFSADSEEATKKELLLTTLSNGAFCGGGFKSNPTASLDDGRIDCIAVKNIGRLKFVSLVGSYKKGLHLGGKFKKIIDHFKCREADMYFDSETPVSVDGEIVRVNELHVRVIDKALKFMLPKGVSAIKKVVEELTAEAALQ